MDKQNNSIVSNPKGVCEKLFTIFRATSPFRIIHLSPQQHREGAPKSSSNSPHVSWLTSSRFGRPSKQVLAPPTGKKHHSRPATTTTTTRPSNLNPRPKNKDTKPIVLPIHGHENTVPSMVEHSHVVSSSSTNINGMFLEFIDRTKQRFHTMPSTSNAGISKTG